LQVLQVAKRCFIHSLNSRWRLQLFPANVLAVVQSGRRGSCGSSGSCHFSSRYHLSFFFFFFFFFYGPPRIWMDQNGVNFAVS
jgi:hypothetical protein